MGGYSGTPLVMKLGIRAGSRVAVVGYDADAATLLGPTPEGCRLRQDARGGSM